MLAVIVWLLFCLLCGKWASNWNRSPIVWFCIAFLLSPLIAALSLLFVGKNK